MNKISVGCVGLGGFGGVHLRTWLRMVRQGKAEITALCDINEKTLKIASEMSRVTNIYTDYREMFKDTSFKAVDIVVTLPSIPEVVLAAVEAGKDMLTEKPMAQTLEKCDSIIDAVKQKGVKVMVAHNRRYHKAYATAKKWIDEGRIGKLWGYNFVWRHFAAQVTAKPVDLGWGSRTEPMVSGCLMDHGVHAADLINWYFGDVEEVSAFSVGRREEHTTVTILRHRNGVLGQLLCGWLPCRPPEEAITIYGYEGCIEVDGVGLSKLYQVPAALPSIGELRSKSYDPRETSGVWDTWWPRRVGTPHAARMEALTGRPVEKMEELRDRGEYEVEGEIEHFIHCIIENKQPRPSPEDERKAIGVILAAYRSADTGKAVRLPL